MNKKTIFVFVFDGYADWEISRALTALRQSNRYLIKAIALEKAPVVSLSGMRIIPDLDFFPHIDLKDIDCGNTAMVILPGGSIWTNTNHSKNEIELLIAHCVEEHIPLAATGDATLFLTSQHNLDHHVDNGMLKFPNTACAGDYTDVKSPTMVTTDGAGNITFAQTIFEVLKLNDQACTKKVPCLEKHYV